MFELQQVSKSFAGHLVLHPLDYCFQPQACTVLIGPSGCGKSTVLRLLIGLLAPDSGRVCFAGVPIDKAHLGSVRQRMGYVIQDGGLFPHLTARDNTALMARHLGWNDARIGDRVEQLTDLTRFPRAALSRFPAQLSGGQRQRVGIMRALMLDPDALLLDEPMGALDPLVRYELQQDLRDIFKSMDKTVVLVTHDLVEAAFFADHVVLMNEGRIAQQGKLAEMIRAPADDFVTRFVSAQRPPQLEEVNE